MIDSTASAPSTTEVLTLSMSVVWRTILLPAITSTEEPDGIGMSLMTYTSTLVSTSTVLEDICTDAVIEAPLIFVRVSPIITVVLDAGTVYTVAREVSIPALVFSLNVFAICYPNAIAIAVAVSSAVLFLFSHLDEVLLYVNT